MDMTSEPSLDALTFVFTDLESSTRLWERFPEAMNGAMERHDAILQEAVEDFDGRVVKIMGDGVMAVFSSAADAVEACLRAQRTLRDETWRDTGPLHVRMGIHVGEAVERGDDFLGPPVNRAARIMAAAHGGQVLLSGDAADVAQHGLPEGAVLRDLGEHQLKDLFQPEHIFQLVHPALAREFPPLATLSQRPNNLPTQTSEFLGREAQLAAIRDLLDADGVRLLTLTGPGGIGKTRLALQAAADQIDRYEDGVYFVDVADARHADAVFDAIARAVGLTRKSEERLIDVLKRELRARHMLLVVDNFEQVMAAAEGLTDLLQRCSQVKVLVTSREALSVRGEHLLGVPPLAVPAADRAMSAELVEESEAVRLFVERAREARPGFTLTDDNASAVAEITSRLDGLPLALELAAARAKLFSPQELRDRLRSRLDLLARGPRDLPVRQRTLRSTIDWSYQLLDEEERAILQLLSVFSPTRIEAVEGVGVRLESLRAIDVVDALTSLMDKSLVHPVEGAGPQRLSMLGTIRDYAGERLNDNPRLHGAARHAHAAYFSDFADGRADRLYGPEREATLADLELELGNLLSAWRYWVAAGNLEELEKLLDGLWLLHDARGWYHGAVELSNDLLAVLSAAPRTPSHAYDEIALRTSLARGLLALRGYTREAEETFMRVLALSEQAGELPQRFSVLRSLATFYTYRGEFGRAAAIGQELLELAERQDDPSLEVEGLLVAGASVAFQGDISAGLEHLDRAIALFDPQRHQTEPLRLGPSSGVAAHTTSAFLLWLVGAPEQAATRAVRAVELGKQLNHPFTLAYTLFHVGLLDLWRRDFQLARERADGVLEVAEEHDYSIWRALALALQGAAMVGLDQPEEGLARIDRGLELYQGLKTPPVFWPLLLCVRAGAFGLGGRPAEGLDVVDQAIEATGEGHVQYPEFALLKGDLLLALDRADEAEPRFRSAFDVARALGLRLPQLRAATRLTRLWRAAGKRPDGSDALRDVFETFTEGFETPDLLEARAVLDEVETRVS
jgi:predicted ATPase/class 3 adenylate cyclase